MLYLIEKNAGRDAAILASKMFMIDLNRNSQSPFIIFEGQKDHDDERISKAQHFIEKNYHEKISVDELAGSLALSRRSLERRFRKATSNTVLEYIQRTRVEAAKSQLEKGGKNIHEIMYEVGYSDTKSFRDVFKKYAGMPPQDYRKKYQAF